MVIDPNAEKVYSASGDFSRLIRTPDLRLIGLRFESWTFDRPFRHRMTDTQRACFYYVKRGAGWYRSGSGAEGLSQLAGLTASELTLPPTFATYTPTNFYNLH